MTEKDLHNGHNIEETPNTTEYFTGGFRGTESSKEVSTGLYGENTAEAQTEIPAEVWQAATEDAQKNIISEFEAELENYLPTPENTDKLKKPLPSWVWSSIASATVCLIFLTVYSVFVIPALRPSAIISYTQANAPADIDEAEMSQGIYDKLSQSMVSISGMSSYRSFFGVSSAETTGTGVVLAENGYILTGSSIIGDGSNIKVRLYDNSEYDAELVGSDTAKDIAILKINAENLSPATLADSETVKPGDSTVVISNILGTNLGTSITKGIICGVNKNIALQNGSTVNLLQTDAATNSNSAGGCLLNANGDIIGMITYAISSNAENISFAIPSNDIKNITQSLISTGESPSQLIIGLTGSDTEHGVVIESILPDTPAERAKLQIGDLILKVDNKPVKSIADINTIRDSHLAGDKMIITIYRNGEILDIEIKI